MSPLSPGRTGREYRQVTEPHRIDRSAREETEVTAQAPAALGQESSLGSAWAVSRPAADSEASLSPARRRGAALLGLAVGLALLAACAVLAVLISAALFEGYSGGIS
jgi:hypothetical protein